MRYINYKPTKWNGSLSLIIILFIVLLIYIPGLKGGFLFDDYPNLAGLIHISNFDSFFKFILSGDAGPTGRPISLLTFALQADTITPFYFKVVNLIIHLLCGLLLYWSTALLLKSYRYENIHWIALFASAIWLLHPFFVSTTLYTIQRMAQLPALFSLIAIIGYLKGRSLLIHKPNRAYIIMSVFIVLGTILATYSKENGALLPLLILIIEFCNPVKLNRPIWYWRAVFLWVPSFLILLLLFYYIDFSSNPWPERNFNQIQRLWTESRILCSYLYQLIIPRIEGNGLFQDGYTVSTGWLKPINTLLCVAFIFVLILSSFIVKGKYPLFSLAILFFFSAHLIESTVIGLELYFEHRNYIAALFLFLPIAAGIVFLSEKIDKKLITIMMVIILGFLSFLTWQRVKLWSNIDKLQIYWAQKNPNSDRAQTTYANILWKSHEYTLANKVLEDALKENPSATIGLQLLSQKIQLNIATIPDIKFVERLLLEERIDGEVIWQLRWLISVIANQPEISKIHIETILSVLQKIQIRNKVANPDFPALNRLLQGQLYVKLDQQERAYDLYKESTILYNDLNSSLAVVTDFANRGDKILALKLLSDVEQYYKKQLVVNIAMQKAAARLRKAIQQDIQLKKG